MSQLHDERLAAHLARRGMPPARETDQARSDRLTAAIVAQLADEPQAASWRLRLNAWPRSGALAGAAFAVGLILVVSLSGLLNFPPAASQGPTPESVVRVLNASELSRLVGPTSVAAVVDQVVIVDADVREQAFRCLLGSPCAIGSIAGSDPPVLVYAEDMADKVLPTSAPLAVRIRGVNSVDLVGHVRRPAATELAWTLPAVIEELGRLEDADRGVPAARVVPALFAVEAWLIEEGGPPSSCPVRAPSAPASSPYGCGSASWLSPTDASATTFEADSRGESWTVRAPQGGLRVQNGAYLSFAQAPSLASDPPLPIPKRAIYLVRPLVTQPADCFLCPPAGAVELVSRLDPIEVPPEATPTTALPRTVGEVQVLSLDELQRLVDSEGAGGRVVVANVHVRTDVIFDCFGECPFGYIDGSDPMIWVYGFTPWAADKPLALRIRAAHGVDLVGNVVLPGDGGSTWTVPGFVDSLPPPGSESGLFAIDGWLSRGVTAPPCPAPTEPTPPPGYDYGCGPVAWLGPTDAGPVNEQAPIDALRAQNGAYQAFAQRPGGSPSRAVYLVEPLIRNALYPVGSCYSCPSEPLLHIVARVDPVEIPPAPPSSEGPPLTGAISIRTILDDPTWSGVPVLPDAVILCRGSSECGSAPLLYPGIPTPAEDVDFSSESMLRIVNGTPILVSWDSEVLTIRVAPRDAGFWEGAIGIDLGDVPIYGLKVEYLVLISLPSG